MSSSNVTVTINGQDYPMSCAPGEEKKVEALGARLDAMTQKIKESSGAIAESRLLVMTALIVMDQMKELEDQIAGKENPADSPDEDSLAKIIDNLAARLEKLA